MRTLLLLVMVMVSVNSISYGRMFANERPDGWRKADLSLPTSPTVSMWKGAKSVIKENTCWLHIVPKIRFRGGEYDTLLFNKSKLTKEQADVLLYRLSAEVSQCVDRKIRREESFRRVLGDNITWGDTLKSLQEDGSYIYDVIEECYYEISDDSWH